MTDEMLTPEFSLPSAPPPPADQEAQEAREDVLGSLADHQGYGKFRELFVGYIQAYRALTTVDLTAPNERVGEETKVAVRVAEALEQILGAVEDAHAQAERRRHEL